MSFHVICSVLPCAALQVTEYTDFYSCINHAENCSVIMRGDKTLPPAYLHLPIAYHSRASSVVVSGTDIRRPNGLTQPDPKAPPVFGPCKKFDFELELGIVVGGQLPSVGYPIPVDKAHNYIFGRLQLHVL